MSAGLVLVDRPFSNSRTPLKHLTADAFAEGKPRIAGKIFINANEKAKIVNLEQCKLL